MKLRCIAAACAGLVGMLMFVVGAASAAGSHQTAVITPAPAFTASQLAQNPADDWITVGGNLQDNRYSQLDQITKANVGSLKVAWTTHMDGSCATASSCGGEGNALVYKGVMYVASGADAVFALDATTGDHIWKYLPALPAGTKAGAPFNNTSFQGNNRGIALGDGKIFVGQNDAELVAVDQLTGGVVWRTQTAPWQLNYKITAAPVYYDGMVIIGMSGGDSGNRDFVAAYDATNGILDWIWYVIPAPGQPGYETWGNKTSWNWGGGAIFDTPVVDPQTGTVFVGTGNPEPWNNRPAGKELYVDSIVALNARTGHLNWAYQTVHHDIWDNDIPNPGILVTGKWRDYKIVKAGKWVDNPAQGWSGSKAVGVKVKYTSKPKTHQAVVYPSKMGFTFVLDRKTGKPLIPTPEMTIVDPNQKQAAGMNLSKTQPIPVGDYWAAQCVLPTQWNAPGPDGQPVVHGCNYTPYNTTQFAAIPHDEGEWMPAAYYPPTNSINICIIDNRAWAFQAIPTAQLPNAIKPGSGATGILSTHGNKDGYTGRVTNQNVLTNKTIWHKDWPDWCYSGTVTTKTGLMFVSHNDGSMEAYDVTNGTSLFRGPKFPAGADSPGMIYAVNGKEYLSQIVAGNNHENDPRGDLIVTYSLP
jgi:quinohemoprotein ethanol dehydrogenase